MLTEGMGQKDHNPNSNKTKQNQWVFQKYSVTMATEYHKNSFFKKIPKYIIFRVCCGKNATSTKKIDNLRKKMF